MRTKATPAQLRAQLKVANREMLEQRSRAAQLGLEVQSLKARLDRYRAVMQPFGNAVASTFENHGRFRSMAGGKWTYSREQLEHMRAHPLINQWCDLARALWPDFTITTGEQEKGA